MENQSITVTKILSIYAKIRHANHMADIVTNESLKNKYQSEAMGMWDALDVLLGNNNMVNTIDQVVKLANLRAIKAA